MRIAPSITAAALLLVASLPASASIFTYVASLSGPAESPPNASPATGSGTVTFDDVLKTLRVQATFSGLTGTTTASHIHCCTLTPLTGTAGVATTTPNFVGFPLGVTAGVFDQTYDMTLASSFNAAFITANGGTAAAALPVLAAGLASGRSYLNIHTSTFGGGEIRGFLTPIPVPGSAGVFAVGLLGLAGALRRRRARAHS